MRVLYFVPVLLLGACSFEHQETPQETRARHVRTCKKLGFHPGAPSYNTCMETQVRQDEGEFADIRPTQKKKQKRRMR